MGTWNTKIKGNDTTLDIYTYFYDRYNSGDAPEEISAIIKKEYSLEFQDYDDKNNAIFGLALAQWETKSLELDILNEVKRIIESGDELMHWKDSDKNTKIKRKKELDFFLIKISKMKEKPKRRIKSKNKFEEIEIVKVVSPDNMKEFHISEEFENDQYIHTSAVMNWYNMGGSTGGSGILYFKKQGCKIKAKWEASNILIIEYPKGITFSKQEQSFFFCGDKGVIKYIEK